jgi:YVTN family beta-propeller protein
MEVPGQFAGGSKGTAAGTFEFQELGEFRIREKTNRSGILRNGKSGRRLRNWGCAGFFALASVGCGNQYRPVVNPVRPTGPSPAPQAYAVAVTQPTGAQAGIATVIDFSGDTVLAQATLGNFPLDFAMDGPGATAYTIDRDGSLSVIPISTSLQTKNVGTSTLNSTAVPINTTVGTGNIYVIDASVNEIDVLTGNPPGLKQALPLPAGLITLAGRSSSSRFYAISQNVGTPGTASPCATPSTVTTPGVVSALEASTFSISATIPVGICPVYGLQSADGLRTFILNRGSGTVTVIDSQKNTLDSQTNPATGYANSTFVLPAGPVYAELYDTSSQLVTANYDSNTVSVIDVSTDAFDNDSPQFGTIHTVPVGNGPTSVTVLQDGTRAYVANSKDSTISVVNLSTYTVEKVISLPLNPDLSTPHPRLVASTYNYPTGKVYVTAEDSSNLVILRTDTDTVDATLQLQGNLIDVRVTRQNAGTTTQIDNVSYSPGNGVPCTPGTVPTQLSKNPTACQLEGVSP